MRYMLFLSIVSNYMLWHYSRAFLEIFHVWFNFIWFTVHFFSIPQLMGSWFSPWKRIVEERGNRWDFEDLAGFVIIGLLSRIVGFFIRTIVIASGLISLFFVVVCGFATYVFWLAAPLFIIALISIGLTILFT